MDPLDPVATEPWRPEVAPQVPARLGEVLVGEPSARLVDEDVIALLSQPQARDRPAEAGADDDDVVVVVRSRVSSLERTMPRRY
jgi:hypothetical protein